MTLAELLAEAAKREQHVRDEWPVLARLAAETARTNDPWTAARKTFGGDR